MTIVVGAHLGDGVGVAADTRVHYGSDVIGDDALKVYQYPPYFIVGIAGDALAAVTLLTDFYIRFFMRVTREQGFAQAVDHDWMQENLRHLYRDLKRCHGRQFGLVFAADDTLLHFNPGGAHEPTMNVAALHNASFDTSAEVLTQVEDMPGKRLLMSLSFPDENCQIAGPGQVISIGSGVQFEPLLKSSVGVVVSDNLSLGDRFAAFSRDLGTLDKLAADTSFNGFCIGIVYGRSDASLTLHGYHDWPHGSVPEDYEWEPSDPRQDAFPHMMPYTVGYDQRDIETAWIYRGNDDPQRCTKLRLQSFREPEFINQYARRTDFRFMV